MKDTVAYGLILSLLFVALIQLFYARAMILLDEESFLLTKLLADASQHHNLLRMSLMREINDRNLYCYTQDNGYVLLDSLDKITESDF